MAEIEERYFQESDEDLPEEIDRRLAEIEAQFPDIPRRAACVLFWDSAMVCPA